MRKIIFVILLFLFQVGFSQSDADRLLQSARKNIDAGRYKEAIQILDQAKKVDASNVGIYYLYAEIYSELKNYEKVEEVFSEASKEQGQSNPILYLMLGNTQKYLGKYTEAKQNYEKYLAHPHKNPKYLPRINRDIKSCEFAENAKKHPVPFNPVNLGKGVNSVYSEYLPALNAEENTLVFTRRVPDRQSYGSKREQEDFYWSHKEGNKWGKASALGGKVNTSGNEGAQSLSADGRYLFFTACHREDGLGGCDIYLTRLENGKWLKPMNLGEPVNSKYWESQPAISPDSRTLYFVSDRPGGYGKLDIWKSTIGKDGKFSKPVNLGATINTDQNEASPFIHLDNKTLYFSSTGLIGMGGYDIFVSKKINDSLWTEPKNLGYPINTEKDENSLIVNAKGNTAYYASDKKGGYGEMDLYSFDLYKEVRPVPVSYFKGIISDAETHKPLSAKFELIDIDKDSLIITSFSRKTDGSFLICIPAGVNYALNVSKDGYLFYSGSFFLKQDSLSTKPFVKNIELQKITKGASLVLNNIFFDTDSYELKPESKVELRKLIDFLNKNSSLKIEISGHTDNTGSTEHNLKLSENRAKAIYNYLIENGIKAGRLTYKGYGSSKAIADNKTEEGRAKNRRTEFKILEQ